jgi:phosphatidylcholine synthase
VYTASGAICSLYLALAVLDGDPRRACLWMLLALGIDSSDGWLARRWDVKGRWPQIDGRKIDDIVDYLNYTFLPLLLCVTMGWLPEPAAAWVALPLLTSLFAFANVGIKQDDEGFFVGFPSYWNVTVLYFWLLQPPPWLAAVILVILGVLTVVPLRFLYPSRMPRLRRWFVLGGVVWGMSLIAALLLDPVPGWLAFASLAYPAAYFVGSVSLSRNRKGTTAVR